MTVESVLILGRVYRTYGGMLAIAILFLQIVVIISVLRGTGTTGHKLLWTVMILALPVLGLILYALFGRSRRDRPMLE